MRFVHSFPYAILKMNQAQEGFMGARNIRALTGMTGDAE